MQLRCNALFMQQRKVQIANWRPLKGGGGTCAEFKPRKKNPAGCPLFKQTKFAVFGK